MPKAENSIKEPMVTVRIVQGKATKHHSKLWRAFWTRLLATAQSEFKSESEREREYQ